MKVSAPVTAALHALAMDALFSDRPRAERMRRFLVRNCSPDMSPKDMAVLMGLLGLDSMGFPQRATDATWHVRQTREGVCYYLLYLGDPESGEWLATLSQPWLDHRREEWMGRVSGGAPGVVRDSPLLASAEEGALWIGVELGRALPPLPEIALAWRPCKGHASGLHRFERAPQYPGVDACAYCPARREQHLINDLALPEPS